MVPRKLSAILALAAVIGVLIVGLHPAAASAPGSGPDAALAPGSGWTPLAVGQQLWYAFQYAGDGSQVLVDLRASPGNVATFAVWTPATVASWAAGNVPKPVGVGSGDSYVNGDLVWLGAFKEPGTYYVVVNQTGSVAGGVNLTVIGSGVSISMPGPAPTNTSQGPASTPTATPGPPGAASIVATTATPTGSPTGASPAVTAATAGGARSSIRQPSARAVPGSGPDAALAPGSGWTPLAMGQQVWYAFQYAGDRSQVQVDMAVSPRNLATFAVWTQATLATWAAGNVPNPVGVGSPDNYVNDGDMVWSGSFNQPGTYYVVVNQTSTEAGGTLLKITGTGVSGGGRSGAQLGGR